MSKRGQVTIFLVVGITILLLSALFFYVFSQMKKAPLEVEQQQAQEGLGTSGAVQSLVEDCIKKTVDPSLYLLAIQGGIIYPEKDSKILLMDYGLVNYAWINGAAGISRTKMELDLGAYLQENFPSCVGNFESFAKQKILVEPDYSKAKATVSIKETTVEANFKLPLKITQASGDIKTLDAFSAAIPSSLGKILSSVEKLQFPHLDPTDLINLPYQATIFPFDPAVTIYSISEENKEAPLSFMFAVRNDFPESQAPSLHYISDKTFRVGDQWQEILIAEHPTNDLLEFSSDSELFPIAQDGSIDAIITQAGKFVITFTVTDTEGETDQQKVTVTVVSSE